MTVYNFDFIKDRATRECVTNGVYAMDSLKAWDWLRSFEPDPQKGFLFSNDDMLTSIGMCMEANESMPVAHSGASFAITMRKLKYIADNGMDAFKKLFDEPQQPQN